MTKITEHTDCAWSDAVADQPPCGPSLDYDPDFLALESAARGSAEQQYGSTIVPAQPPDWRSVAASAASLLGRSKDLRVLVLWTRAMTHLEGLAGTACGLEAIAALVKAHWAHVHPMLDEDGDPFVRMNAIAALSERGGLLLELRNSAFLQKRNLKLSLRDAEQLLKSTLSHLDNGLTREQLLAALADDFSQSGEQTRALLRCRTALLDLRTELLARLQPSQLPDLLGLEDLFATLADATLDGASVRTPPAESGGDQASPPTAAPSAAHGGIHSRNDACQALERVCAWLEANEPSNPSALLIRRAQRMMGMSFLDVIREFAPENLSHFEIVTTGRQSG